MKYTFFILAVIISYSIDVFAQNDTITRSNELKEVVVKATKPLTKFDSDGIITTVTGTPLQSLSTANELLGYIPGVVNNNGIIEIVGKGRPIIYINGRKLLNLSELDQLSASKVKEVKVINNPGARYSGDINAVIRITTERELGDGFSLSNRAVGGVRTYFYGKDYLDMNYRAGGMDVFATMGSDNGKGKGSRRDIQRYWGAHERINMSIVDACKHSKRLEGKIGLNYSSAFGHNFGAFYQNTFNPSKSNSTGISSLIVTETMPTEADKANIEDVKYYENLVDTYYSGIWGKWNVTANFDYLWRKSNNRQQIQEVISGHPLSELKLHDKSHGRMFAGELHFSRSVGNGRLELGSEYTNTVRTENFFSNTTSINSLNNEIGEKNIGIYGQYSQTFDRIMLQAGLRYEHINGDYCESGFKTKGQTRHFNEVFPSLAMTLRLKQTILQFSFSRSYTLPLYSQLSGAVHYVDQYTYESGNPNLKNAFTENVSLNFRYKWLMATTSYKHIHNRIITSCTEYQDKPDVILLSKDNSIKNADNIELIVSAMPGYIGNFYYPVAMAGVVSQFYTIDFRGREKRMNSPMFLIRFNNIFKLPQEFMIYTNLNYMSSFDSENIHMGHLCQLDVSFFKAFNMHWDVRLAFNDIFNTAKKRKVAIFSGLYYLNTLRVNPIRGCEVTIAYKFNITKSKYKGEGAGNREKNRL